MAFRDIAEKEKCTVTDAEVNEQLDVIVIQAKQKGEQPPGTEEMMYLYGCYRNNKGCFPDIHAYSYIHYVLK
jgi:hypothetical protein